LDHHPWAEGSEQVGVTGDCVQFGGLGEAGFRRVVAAKVFEKIIAPGQWRHAKANTTGKFVRAMACITGASRASVSPAQPC